MYTLNVLRWPFVMVALVGAAGCMASGWMGGKASEPSKTEHMTHHVEVNLRRIRLAVPAGGRTWLPVDPGPLIVPRTNEEHLKARSIFSRECGKSRSLGKDLGAFQISLQVVSIPRRLGPAPKAIDDLMAFIGSGQQSSSERQAMDIAGVSWVRRESPKSMFGPAYLYTRRLDDDVLITLFFSLDRDRMQSDPAWVEARRHDIDAVLRSVVIE